MPNTWTIHPNGLSGGNNKSYLNGCHITENTAGTAYMFTEPNINIVLATTTGGSLPTPPFTFPEFGYEGFTWTIEVTTLTGGASSNKAEGTWATAGTGTKETGPQSGDWTAQAGSTVGDDLATGKTA